MILVLPLLLIILHQVNNVKSICVNQFPLRETSAIIKQLVETYAKTVNSTDGEETWINHLLLEKSTGYELDGVTYYVNDNRLSPENTFYFDSLRFLQFPAYVLEDEVMVERWRASHPDNTYSLSKISLSCPTNFRACGLKCCPSIFYEVMNVIQTGLISSSNVENRNETMLFNGVTYALHPPKEEENVCEYEISYYDVPLRSSLNRFSKIYFSCGSMDDCCGLVCIEKPKPEPITQESRYNINIFKKYHVYTIASILLVIGFVTVVAVAYRKKDHYDDSESPRSSQEKFITEEA